MIYHYSCDACDKHFDEFRSVEERHNVFHCGVRANKHITTDVQVPDDLMYQFTKTFNGKEVRITSKQHYNRVLKENGLVNVTIPEVKSIKKNHSSAEQNTKKMEDRIRSTVAKEGLTKHLDGAIGKCLK